MLNYNPAIKENKNYNDLIIKEIAPIMKLNIRGKKREFFTSVGKILNMILPTEANTSSANDKHTSIWLSPDEWMIQANNPVENNNNSYEWPSLHGRPRRTASGGGPPGWGEPSTERRTPSRLNFHMQ